MIFSPSIPIPFFEIENFLLSYLYGFNNTENKLSGAGFGALTNYMHSNDVMTENTLNFLNKPNELYGKTAVDTKDDFSWSL